MTMFRAVRILMHQHPMKLLGYPKYLRKMKSDDVPYFNQWCSKTIERLLHTVKVSSFYIMHTFLFVLMHFL